MAVEVHRASESIATESVVKWLPDSENEVFRAKVGERLQIGCLLDNDSHFEPTVKLVQKMQLKGKYLKKRELHMEFEINQVCWNQICKSFLVFYKHIYIFITNLSNPIKNAANK